MKIYKVDTSIFYSKCQRLAMHFSVLEIIFEVDWHLLPNEKSTIKIVITNRFSVFIYLTS